jgi:hypothetical protein
MSKVPPGWLQQKRWMVQGRGAMAEDKRMCGTTEDATRYVKSGLRDVRGRASAELRAYRVVRAVEVVRIWRMQCRAPSAKEVGRECSEVSPACREV